MIQISEPPRRPQTEEPPEAAGEAPLCGEASGQGEAAALAGALMRCAFLMTDAHADLSKLFGLHPQQAHLLCVVGERAPTIGEVGGVMRLGKSSMTGLVGRAEAAGLLERVRDESDARAARLRLTAEGLALTARFKAEAARNIARMAEVLPEADRLHLARSLRKMAEAHQARETALNL